MTNTQKKDGFWPLIITLGVILCTLLLFKFTGVNLLQTLVNLFGEKLTEIFSVGAQ